jgi:protein gp37
MGTARIREFNPNPKIATAFAGTTINDGNGVDWSGKVNLLDDRLTQPMAWKKPVKVFVNSLSDLFHKDVPSDYIAQVFAVMALTPRHTYQVLTKRHARMKSLLNQPSFHLAVLAWTARMQDDKHPMPPWNPGDRTLKAWPLPNVWLGVSVEDQKWADTRIPALLETPAAVRFLSCEPLLGPITLAGHWTGADPYRRDEPSISWLIVGGESGHGARPMHPDWARSLRDQCQEADVPFLFKQFGEWAPSGAVVIRNRPEPGSVLVGSPVDEHGHRVELRRVGKKAAGRELDGRTWDEFPVGGAA